MEQSYDAATLAAILNAAGGGPSNKAKPAKAKAEAKAAAPPADVIVVEKAKTGRATCRSCKGTLEMGEQRVGMYAWIAGRNSLTWQKPQCFMNNLTVAVQNGRGVCKKSGKPIVKGDVKLGLRSHTATSWVSLACAAKVLAPVLKCGARVPAEIDGVAALTPEQRSAVVKALGGGGQVGKAGKDKAASKAVPSKAPAVKKTIEKAGKKTAPAVKKTIEKAGKKTVEAGKATHKVGSKVGSGNVSWKFGAAVAHGVLMPEQETDTMCYARTGKGNTKALGKGKDYWWKN
jgi:hypothetical protein